MVRPNIPEKKRKIQKSITLDPSVVRELEKATNQSKLTETALVRFFENKEDFDTFVKLEKKQIDLLEAILKKMEESK